MENNKSPICLACGLCCNGVLHGHAVVKPEEIEAVKALGLAVEPYRQSLGFRQPCPLYGDRRCSAYPDHPSTCRAYRCTLLKKVLAGEVAYEEGMQTIQRAYELFAAVVQQLPPGHSFFRLRMEMDQEWDSERGIFGSGELRQANAEFLLAMAKLMRYLQRHFGKPKMNEIK